MNTIRLQIRDAIIAALNTERPSDIPEATKRRFLPGNPIRDANIAVFFNTEDVALVGNKHMAVLTKRTLHILVQCSNGVENNAEADDSVEDLLAWVATVLGATNLGGLATNVEEGPVQWESAPMDLFYVVATQRWSIDYQTNRSDETATS